MKACIYKNVFVVYVKIRQVPMAFQTRFTEMSSKLHTNKNSTVK